jgi:hypothetical protein
MSDITSTCQLLGTSPVSLCAGLAEPGSERSRSPGSPGDLAGCFMEALMEHSDLQDAYQRSPQGLDGVRQASVWS